jgi:hypothetical protein
MEYIALDAHGAYNFASIERSEDGSITEAQIPRRPGAIAEFPSVRTSPDLPSRGNR